MPRTPPTTPDGAARPEDRGFASDAEVMTALFSPAGRDDPQSVLRRATVAGCRHAVVSGVLRDPRFAAPVPPESGDLMFQTLARWMLRVDGPRHRSIRSRFAGLFTPRRVERFRPLVEQRTHELLDAIGDRPSFDLVADFARALPFEVICDVMGVPQERRSWLSASTAVLGQSFAEQRDPAAVQRGNAAAAELLDGFSELLDAREGAAGDDLMSVLAADGAATDDRDDIVANCVFFVLAGHETTCTLLAHGAHLLCRNPSQLDAVRADPDRWPDAVEELLRITSPVTLTGALAREDVDVAGVHFPAGSQPLIAYAAANHDPAVFDDPHTLDVTRDASAHLAFSIGGHYCLGAPLARMEARIGLAALFDRYPRLRVDDPVWRGSAPLRQIESLRAYAGSV